MARATWGFPGFGIRGRAGGLEFLARKDGGTTVRAIPVVRAERTPLQREGEARLKLVAAAWKGLTMAEGEAWGRWGEGEGRQAYNAFSGLAAKCLQMRPSEAVPKLPPTTAFLGDGIVVKGTPSPTVPPRARASLQGEPSLTFSSSAPNTPGVVTELMTQRLASAHRKPVMKAYRTARFVAFAAGSLEATVPCEAGAYALAVRFVRWDTGQETAVLPLGKVVVP